MDQAIEREAVAPILQGDDDLVDGLIMDGLQEVALCQVPLAGDLDLFALDRDKAGAAESAAALFQGGDFGCQAAGTEHDDATLENLLPQQAVEK